MANGIKRD